MKISLSEHRSCHISLAENVDPQNPFHFTEAVFNKIDITKINAFKTERGRDLFPFYLKAKDKGYDLQANYYVGIDWLIKGEKFVQVEPKINKAVINAFVEQIEIEDPDIFQIDHLEKKVEDALESGEGFVEIDYLRILIDLSSSAEISNELSHVLKIDWEAPQIPIEQKDDRLTPFLIVQFLRVLKSIVRKGLKKSYYKVQENLTNRVKGKILVGQHIKQNVFKNRLTKTYCEYQEFGVDDLENRFLKKVFSFAINYVQNDQVFFRNCKNDLVEIINYCRPAFELVSNDIKEQELKNIKYNPFFKEYKNAIKTGGYILKRFAYNISSTSETLVKTPPFWIDMPILFELYVYQKLLKANNFDAKKIQFQFKTYGNHLDFLINDGDNSMIIDAKYKVHYQQGHIHQDIRQVSGYARLNAVREKLKVEDDSNINCLIIYPTLEKHETDFNLDKIVEGFNNDNNRIMAYHKVYKLGVTLPTINK